MPALPRKKQRRRTHPDNHILLLYLAAVLSPRRAVAASLSLSPPRSTSSVQTLISKAELKIHKPATFGAFSRGRHDLGMHAP